MIVVMGESYPECERFIRANFPFFGSGRIEREFLIVWRWQDTQKLHGLERGQPFFLAGKAIPELIDFAKHRFMRQVEFVAPLAGFRLGIDTCGLCGTKGKYDCPSCGIWPPPGRSDLT